jgi:hypothetical protein
MNKSSKRFQVLEPLSSKLLHESMSKQFANLSSSHPDLWKETRAALGLPEQDDDDVDGDNASVQQKQPIGQEGQFSCTTWL